MKPKAKKKPAPPRRIVQAFEVNGVITALDSRGQLWALNFHAGEDGLSALTGWIWTAYPELPR